MSTNETSLASLCVDGAGPPGLVSFEECVGVVVTCSVPVSPG